MLNKKTIKLLALSLAAPLLLVGCSKKAYQHSRLSPDSWEYKQCLTMLEELRAGRNDGKVIEKQLPQDITPQEKTAAVAALETIQLADEVTLVQMDKFGDNVYRATLEITDGKTSAYAMLLVKVQDKLYWVGKN